MATLTLTPHQQQAFQKLQAFTHSPAARAFVLRGYAGTGKTTLLGQYADWLEAQEMQPVLLATTARPPQGPLCRHPVLYDRPRPL